MKKREPPVHPGEQAEGRVVAVKFPLSPFSQTTVRSVIESQGQRKTSEDERLHAQLQYMPQ